MNNLTGYRLEWLDTIAANTVFTTVQITGQCRSKFAVLASGALRANTRLKIKVAGRGVPASASIDTKGIWIIECTVVTDPDGHFARWPDILQAGPRIIGRITVTNKVVKAKLRLTFNTHTTIPAKIVTTSEFFFLFLLALRIPEPFVQPSLVAYVQAHLPVLDGVEWVADLVPHSTSDTGESGRAITKVAESIRHVVKIDFTRHRIESLSLTRRGVHGTGGSVHTLQGTLIFRNVHLSSPRFKRHGEERHTNT